MRRMTALGVLLIGCTWLHCPAGAQDHGAPKRPEGIPPSAEHVLGSWYVRQAGPRGSQLQWSFEANGACRSLTIGAAVEGIWWIREIGVQFGARASQRWLFATVYEGRPSTRTFQTGRWWGLGPRDGVAACYSPPSLEFLRKASSSDLESNAAQSRDCGETVELGAHGTATSVLGPQRVVKRRKQTGVKCSMGCGEFRPLLRIGEYVVKGSSLNVRTGAGTNHSVKFTLPRGTKVELTEDVGPLEKHDDEIAPWVKVKTKDGRQGFAFGGYLEYTKFWTLTAEEVCNLKGPVGW